MLTWLAMNPSSSAITTADGCGRPRTIHSAGCRPGSGRLFTSHCCSIRFSNRRCVALSLASAVSSQAARYRDSRPAANISSFAFEYSTHLMIDNTSVAGSFQRRIGSFWREGDLPSCSRSDTENQYLSTIVPSSTSSRSKIG